MAAPCCFSCSKLIATCCFLNSFLPNTYHIKCIASSIIMNFFVKCCTFLNTVWHNYFQKSSKGALTFFAGIFLPWGIDLETPGVNHCTTAFFTSCVGMYSSSPTLSSVSVTKFGSWNSDFFRRIRHHRQHSRLKMYFKQLPICRQKKLWITYY